MIERFSIKLSINIRACEQSDLPKLEWFGMFTDYREIILEAFKCQEKDEVIMLVAQTNHFPIGQLWIDLTKQHKNSIGVLWAFRILSPFQGKGIGSCLLNSAERILQEKGFAVSEIGVEKDNPNARRLYERMGYQVVKDNYRRMGFHYP